MVVSTAPGTTAVTIVTIRTARYGGIRARATELTTILCVTQEGVDAREADLTVN
jgi:hypothetical protein